MNDDLDGLNDKLEAVEGSLLAPSVGFADELGRKENKVIGF